MTAAVVERDFQAVEEVRQPSAVVPAASPPTVLKLMDMIDKAVTSGNIDLVGKMMDYQERWERSEAVKAFNNALADAKAEIKPVIKNRRVQFEAKSGGSDVDYEHEDLAAISDQIDEVLSRYGLFYRWRTINDFASGMVKVVCVVSHRLGYSEENELSAKVDAGAGKNHLQAIASAVTYLERYTLKAALGIASKHDDDGRAAGMVINPDPGRTQQRASAEQTRQSQKISPAQAAELTIKLDAAKEKGADEDQFWLFVNGGGPITIKKVEDVTVDRLPTIISALKSRYGV